MRITKLLFVATIVAAALPAVADETEPNLFNQPPYAQPAQVAPDAYALFVPLPGTRMRDQIGRQEINSLDAEQLLFLRQTPLHPINSSGGF